MRDYDPLSVDELGQNAARALMSYPAVALPPEETFAGTGVYTLHYTGGFPAYAGMGDDEPIYVGKANPSGGRQGRDASARLTSVLRSRLAKHARSIEAVRNLDLRDFRCR